METRKVKCVSIGDPGTGKTSFILAWSNSAFPERDTLLPGVVAAQSTDLMIDGKGYSIELVDSDGSQKGRLSRLALYPGSHVILVFASVIDSSSLDSVAVSWSAEISANCAGVPWFLVGAQSDRKREHSHRMVSADRASDLARRLGAKGYREVSSMTAEGMRDVILGAVKAANKGWESGSEGGKRVCSVL